MAKRIIECANSSCPKKGDGPNGRLILGKENVKSGSIELRCRGCRVITRYLVCPDCGKVTSSVNPGKIECRVCHAKKLAEAQRKIDNPKLRAILEG